MIEQLEEFIVQRLQELDPSLDLAPGSRAYRTVVTPLLARLGEDPLATDAVSFMIARLRESFPDIDVSEGSNFKDLVVYPLSAFLEPFRAELVRMELVASSNDPGLLTDEEADRKVSNLFITRRTGEYAFGYVRVYFSTPRLASFDQSTVFATASGIRFVPETPVEVPGVQMRRSGALYYTDVDVRSLNPTSETVSAGEITSVDGVEGVVRVTNPTRITPGTEAETSEELFERAEQELGARSSSTARGARAIIRNNFPTVQAVTVVGFGDPEMTRDILQVELPTPAPAPGRMVLSTREFKTDELIRFQVGESVPFSNRVRLVAPTAAQAESARQARFIRVSDGRGHYDDPLLSRLRQVTQVVEDGADLILILDDFEVYPEPAGPTALCTGGTLDVNASAQNYNRNAEQGEAWSMVADNEGTDMVRGAPLPFSDTAEATTLSGLPATASVGRDFLLLGLNDTFLGAAVALPRSLECWPVKELGPGGSYVRVARRAGLLTDADRELGTVSDDYQFPARLDLAGANRGLRIKAFGAPAYNEGALTDLYDGVTKAPWAKQAGATIQLRDPGDWATWSGAPAASNGVVVTTEPTAPGFDVLGVVAGDFISLAVALDERVATGIGTDPHFDGTLAAALAGEVTWYGWGRVSEVVDEHTLRVVGVQTDPLLSLPAASKAAFDWATGTFDTTFGPGYRVLWTVYEGQVTLRDTSGENFVDYSDFAFLPGYTLDGAAGAIGNPWYAEYLGSGYFTSTTKNQGIEKTTPTHRAALVRLKDSILDMVQRPEVEPGEVEVYAPVSLENASGYITALGQVRYPEHTSFEFRSGSGAIVAVMTRNLLPISQGGRQTSKDGTVEFDASYPNEYGFSGLLLPYPFGPANLTDPTYAAVFTGDDSIDSQHLQIFEAASTEDEEALRLTVSGIPGSVPFPNYFGDPVTFRNNEVHIGGIVDAIIQSSAFPRKEAEFVSVPELPAWGDVLISGEDGLVDTTIDSSAFFSSSLQAYLTTELGLGAGGYAYVGRDAGGNHLSVILIEAPGVLSLTSFRPLVNRAGGVQIEGSFDNLAGPVSGVRWALVRHTTTSVDSPREMLQSGTGLTGSAKSFQVSVPGGVRFQTSPSTVPIYLEILSGPALGSYLVSSKGAGTLTLGTPLTADVGGADYRIYIFQQTGGVDGVVMRPIEVRLNSDAGDITIPYMHPLEVVLAEGAAFNDDPVTDDALGSDAAFLSDGAALPTLTISTPGFSWFDEGVRVNDAVRLETEDVDYRYFYVTEVTDATLTLDRVVPLKSYSAVGFSIGRPLLSRARVYFDGPTYFEADQNTRLFGAAEDGVVRGFRPSQDEFGELFTTPNTDPCTSSAEGALVGARLAFPSNIFAAGVRAGDRLTLLSTRVQSGALSSPSFTIFGQRLVFVVDDVRRVVTFTTATAMDFDGVAEEINAQLGGYMRATATATQLLIDSTQHVYLEDSGTPGILTTLGFDLADAVPNNKPQGALYFKTYTIDSLDYDPATDTSYVILPERTWADGVPYFLNIDRPGTQVFYPDDMQQEGSFYYIDLRVVSQDPQSGDLVGFQALTAESYRSLGYELYSENEPYSFSVLENLGIRMSPIFLQPGQNSLADALVLSGVTCSAEFEVSEDVAPVQTYMLRRDVRAQAHNMLIRHHAPAYLAADLTVGAGPTTETMVAAIQRYAQGLYENPLLEVSDLLAVLNSAGAGYVQTPVRAGFLVVDNDRRIRLVRTEDRVVLDNRKHVMADTTLVTFGLPE